MEKRCNLLLVARRNWQKIRFLCLLFFLFPALSVSAQQEPTFSVQFKGQSLTEIFHYFSSHSEYVFTYNSADVKSYQGKITHSFSDRKFVDILTACLTDTPFTFQLMDKHVIIKRRPVEPEKASARSLVLKGEVQLQNGQPLPGVTVVVKGTTLGGVTDANGIFNFMIPERDNLVLQFSFVGMKTKEVAYTGQKELDVMMEEEITKMEEVVVTGIFTKARESYTGAAKTITKDELKRVGNHNILTSIRNIDPSFNIADNPMMGSDPNTLPDITVRGNSSMTSNVRDLQQESQNTQSSNLPLFIMDGFEISLERMMDLDDNQVESITLLKDASATAMYGTRGANGVVVITTRQPKPGKLQVTYKGNVDIEAPDLTTYNLLNAKEKLLYEKEAGLYKDRYGSTGGETKKLEDLYNFRMLAAQRGVDTYWLKYPVHTGVGHNHSLRLEGGHEEIRYAVGLSYKNVTGAMKGSERNTFNGNVFLSYRLKNLVFQNDLQVSSNKSKNSPYGSFSEYAKLNSYWKPYDDEGNLLKVLDETDYRSLSTLYYNAKVIYNPLYNAFLSSIDDSKYTQVRDNFSLEWNILPELTFRTRVGITAQTNRSDFYKSANHTDYLSYDGENYERRGKYTLDMGESFGYEANFTLNYNKTFKEVHQVYVGLGYNLAQTKSENYSVTGEGIPNDHSDFLGLTTAYEKEKKPDGSESIFRRTGAVLNLNYTYDRRYFVDASGMMDASSQFGTDNRLAPFWSVGIGWNIHQESWLEDNAFFNQMRLRVSYGTSGTQSFSSYQAMQTFKYFGKENYNGLHGVYMLALGNPDLGWQKTGQVNAGLDFSLWHGTINLNVDFYNKLTNDMLSDITLPLSAGFGSYKANIGKVQNRGVEVSLNAYLFRNTARDIYWSVGGTLAHNKNTVKEISNSLEFLNEELLKKDGRNPSFLFREGESMNTIFAVRSLGIDPSNGQEVYLKRDGTRTYKWDAKDKVACGINEPKVWGNLNTMFRWQGLTLNAVFGYRLGGQTYNSTLAGKVENILPNDNADKRVLYGRWRKPGDAAQFKGIRDFSTTNATTRFVMKENTFECYSVSLGYEWVSEWLKRNLAISYLSLTTYGENLFRISTVKQERGIEYPYARNFSLSLTARF